jgi:uridine kinase
LGRAHSDSGKYFDCIVFIDTPLDVAMARRLVRDLTFANVENATDTVANVKAETEAYLSGARRIYTSFVERVKPNCDLVLDGTLTLDELASAVVSCLK